VIIDIFKGRTRTENAVEGGTVSANNGVASFQFDPTNFQSGNYNVQVRKSGSFSVACSSAPSLKAEKCSDQSRTDDTLLDNEPYDICKQIPDQELQDQCLVCTASGEGGDAGQGGVWTAIGCISRDPIKITERLIQVGLGMGGGVALIMTLAGGFILSTSQGDPQKANQAKEMITNSVIGLLFVIFSVFILQFIGVKILNIPGFGGS